MCNKERIIAELQMLTNVVTNDIDYLVYLLLKDGVYFSDNVEDKFVQKGLTEFHNKVENFEEWFAALKEV